MSIQLSEDTLQRLVDEQVMKWNLSTRGLKKKARPVITISRQAGSGARIVAGRIAEILSLDLYGSRIIDEVAKSAHMSTTVVESLDEKDRSMFDDWISILEKDRNFWSYQFMQHLAKVICTVGRHGNAVILGRGAQFILPHYETFRIRVIASIDTRIGNLAKEFNLSAEDAKSVVDEVDFNRKAFIKKYFQKDGDDPIHYDLVINTSSIEPRDAASLAVAGLCLSNKWTAGSVDLKEKLPQFLKP